MKITSSKLLWTGLTWIVAVVPFLRAIGANVSVGTDVMILIGAIIMIVGCIMHWLDK